MPENNKLFEHQVLDGNVHLLTFHRSTRAAVEEFLAIYPSIIYENGPDKPLRLLVDVRPDGAPSVRYLLNRLRKFYGGMNKNDIPEIYAAYLYFDSVMLGFAQTFLELLGLRAKRKFFEGDYLDEAVAWLQGLDDPASSEGA